MPNLLPLNHVCQFELLLLHLWKLGMQLVACIPARLPAQASVFAHKKSL